MNRRTWLGVAVLAAALAPLALAQEQPGAKDKLVPGAKSAATAKQMAADLREALDLVNTLPKGKTRDRLELLLRRAQDKADDIKSDMAALAAAAKPAAVSEADFAKILAGLKAQTFDKDKVPFVENLGKSRHYTCAQVGALLKVFSFDDGRGKAAVALYPQILDPENFFTVLEVFTFDSGRKAVREQLKLK